MVIEEDTSYDFNFFKSGGFLKNWVRFVFWSNIPSILENIPCVLENNVHILYFHDYLQPRSSVPYLQWVLKSLSSFVELISPFGLVQFLLHKFWDAGEVQVFLLHLHDILKLYQYIMSLLLS